MSDTKWTSGPWKWIIEDQSMATLCGEKNELIDHVMSVSPCKSCVGRLKEGDSPMGVCTMPNNKDANLIAAAPELYEALETCLDCLGDEFALPTDVIAEARSALAKARGEQQ